MPSPLPDIDLYEQVEAIFERAVSCSGCLYHLTWTEPRGEYGSDVATVSMRGCRLLGDGERCDSTLQVERCPALT